MHLLSCFLRLFELNVNLNLKFKSQFRKVSVPLPSACKEQDPAHSERASRAARRALYAAAGLLLLLSLCPRLVLVLQHRGRHVTEAVGAAAAYLMCRLRRTLAAPPPQCHPS